MAGVYRNEAKDGWYAQIWFRNHTRKVWLGKCTKSQATLFSRHLEALKACREVGAPPPAETANWLKKISPRIKTKLEQWGMTDAGPRSSFSPTLGKFCTEYIKSRKDWAPGSVRNMTQAKNHLITQIDKNKMLAHITPGDAERFARWCRNHFEAETHAEKTLQKVKQLFNAAVKERLLTESPFVAVKVAKPVSKSKKQEVSREICDLLIDRADPYLAAVIGFARYGGLRCPSEHLSIEWAKVDWERSRFEVYSPKTKSSRTVPIFPQLKQHLDYLWSVADDKATHVFTMNRSAAARRYRKWMLALIEKTPGVEPWPDLWRNLRLTRKNELLTDNAEHVVCAWLGHDRATGQTYYDMPMDSDYERAAKVW